MNITLMNAIPQPSMKTADALAAFVAQPALQTFSSPPPDGWARNPTEQTLEGLGLYPYSDSAALVGSQLVRATVLRTKGSTLAEACPTADSIKATVKPILPGAMTYDFPAAVTASTPVIS